MVNLWKNNRSDARVRKRDADQFPNVTLPRAELDAAFDKELSPRRAGMGQSWVCLLARLRKGGQRGLLHRKSALSSFHPMD
jgi:hypothetical protein